MQGPMSSSAEKGEGGPFRLVVLASGNGSNLQAIIDDLHGRDGIEVVGVGSDKPDAFALERAQSAGIPTEVFPIEDHPNRSARDDAMADWTKGLEADLIVLAGYMALLTPGFIERFRNRVINVHPSLLPSFPGLDAIGQAIDAGVRVTGVTVHFVDEGTDTGPVILQRPVEVAPGMGRDELEEAIHAVEHALLPEAIGMIATGRVRIADEDPNRVIIDQ
jgi:phosphoribosylglycinamide formyltransferase-1